MRIFTCFACSFLAASLGAGVRLHRIKESRAVVHSQTQVPTPPSLFTIIEKVGEGASGSVYKASTQDGKVFALKMLGPVPGWDSGYQMMGVINREIKAYTRLTAAEHTHTVAFHKCFCGKKLTVDGSGFGMDYVSRTCIKDDAVDPGVVWLQMSLADASFSSYMKSPFWRKQVMLGNANSPLPLALLNQSRLGSAIECETLTKGRGIFNSFHSRFIYLGRDGGVWTSQERDRGPFRLKTYVTLAGTIEDPQRCSSKWCFQVADREFRSESLEVAKEFVGKLRDAKVALHQNMSQSVPLVEFRKIVRDMVLGLKELADAGVIHGDVKPDNLLAPAAPLLTTDKLQWTDFGFAAFSNSSCVDSDSKPAGGTLAYAPPELLAAPNVGDAEGVSPVFDVFAVGLIAFELLTGDSLKTCAVDNGKADFKKLILPIGYVQYSPIAYSDARSEGGPAYQNMPLLLQLLQVIGLPQDLGTMMVAKQDSRGSIPYGNPYESRNFHARNKLYMERAIFAINAAITGEYALDEKRDRLVARGRLAEGKYFGTKLQDCARRLLAKHALELDAVRLEALDLIGSMLAVMPSKRISADDALKHPFLAALDS